jgi:glycosyltransferase involved in cell wall biosynthesis
MDKFRKKLEKISHQKEVVKSKHVGKLISKPQKQPIVTRRVSTSSEVRIVAYCICYNEERLIEFYLRHYLDFVNKVIVYDNMSTDRTRDIIRRFSNVEIRDFDTGGTVDNQRYIDVKNNCYKEQRGKADYCIVSDVDEFLYHPNLRRELSKYLEQGITLPRAKGIEMVGDGHDLTPHIPIYKQITLGVRSNMFNKQLIFSPEVDVNFYPGCHNCRPRGNLHKGGLLFVLHYRFLSPEHVYQIYNRNSKRISKNDKKRGWARHYHQSKGTITKRYLELKKRRKPIQKIFEELWINSESVSENSGKS